MGFPTIAIVGAGPGGLSLARVLQVHAVPFEIYEAELASEARDQGGTLDLHDDSGLIAVERAHLTEEFTSRSRPEGNAVRILGADGTVYLDETADDAEADRPEIDRRELRSMLIESVDPARIHWGHKVTAVDRCGDGRHELAFDHGAAVAADLVVGADGAWSKVRPLVSQVKPDYLGAVMVEFEIKDVDATYVDSAELVGAGSMFAIAPGRGLIAQRNDKGTVRIYAALYVAEGWPTHCGVDWDDLDSARRRLLIEFDGWDEGLTDLIVRAGGRAVPRPLYALPGDHGWSTVHGVTLVGDAAHLMSPFGGHGANSAMLDGVELAGALIEHDGDIDLAVSAYEAALLPRGQAYAAESAQNQEVTFAADAPHGLVAAMRRDRGHGETINPNQESA